MECTLKMGRLYRDAGLRQQHYNEMVKNKRQIQQLLKQIYESSYSPVSLPTIRWRGWGSECSSRQVSLLSVGNWWVQKLGTLKGSMRRDALPRRWRGINGRDPGEEPTLNSSSPSCPADTGISISVDWVKPSQSGKTLPPWPCFWSRLLTPFIVSSSGSDNSISGFAGLLVHRIHKAPRGSTTEMSQKSMKSLPEGFLEDFHSWDRQCLPAWGVSSVGKNAAQQTAITSDNLYRIAPARIFTETELWPAHFLSALRREWGPCPRPQTAVTFRRPCKYNAPTKYVIIPEVCTFCCAGNACAWKWTTGWRRTFLEEAPRLAGPTAFLSPRRPESLVYRPIMSACDSADKQSQSLRASHSEALWPWVRLVRWPHVSCKAKVGEERGCRRSHCVTSQLRRKHLLSSLFPKKIQFSFNLINMLRHRQSWFFLPFFFAIAENRATYTQILSHVCRAELI